MTAIARFRLFAEFRLAGWCAVLVAAWLPTMAQTASPAVGPYRIAGIVVNAMTGDPLRRATVSLLLETDSHTLQSVETASDGSFALERLPAGKYQLTASKRGFRTAFYDEHEEFSTAIVTGEGQETGGLIFRLMPGAVLLGMVTGDGGDPVEGARVMLFERPGKTASSPGRGERITQTDTATTDDTGAYEFDGLAAGEYLLAVQAEPWFALHHSAAGPRKRSAADTPGSQTAALDVVYPVTFFDSTTEEAAATRIPLAGGSRVEADIALHAVPALRLTIETPRKADGSIARAELRRTIFGTQISSESTGFLDSMQTGTTEFTGVAPGRYELVQGDPPRIAEVDATASIQVEATLGTPAFPVSGLLRNDAGTSLADDISLIFQPLDGARRLAPLQATVVRGAFSFPMVPPGNWEIWAESGGLQVPVISTSVDGRPHTGNRVTVKDRPLSLVIMLSQGGTRIEGFARKGGKGTGGVMVVLVPKDSDRLRAMARRDQSDSDGSFSLHDVALGQYTVVAIEDGWGLDWAKPSVLARYLAQGVAVAVTGNQGKLIQLSAPVPVQAR